MSELTVLQRKALDRAMEQTKLLKEGIGDHGACELSDGAYDYASIALSEITHWLNAVIEDADSEIQQG